MDWPVWDVPGQGENVDAGDTADNPEREAVCGTGLEYGAAEANAAGLEEKGTAAGDAAAVLP